MVLLVLGTLHKNTYRPNFVAAKDIPIGAGGLIPGPVKLDTVSSTVGQWPPLRRFCVAQALSRGDEFRHSLHASAQYREYNEDLIFKLMFVRNKPKFS